MDINKIVKSIKEEFKVLKKEINEEIGGKKLWQRSKRKS